MSLANFKNESLCDFTIGANRIDFTKALSKVDELINSSTYISCPIIQGESLVTPKVVESLDPSDMKIKIGRVCYADQNLVERALSSLKGSGWARVDVSQRVAALKKIAENMRTRRYDLAALIIREAGKPWKEADADVAEAIDFCEYYALLAERMFKPVRTQEVPGEENFYYYQPKGIAVVIAPWNFPLAIACGMAVAALVTGNPTILKPAEQTSIIAYEFAKIVLESGVPSDAFAFLPGVGEEIGRALVFDPRTSLICFTGSKNVGMEILKTASLLQPGQSHIKKVIAELGGKNCIIVDEDADQDEAVKGILYSAFGYAGQKCSACSRLICLESIYEQFLDRLCDAASDLIVGAAKDSASYLGPVIDKESQARINNLIEAAKAEVAVSVQGQVPDSGFYVPHTIFKNVDTSHSLWTEEIFGPVLSCRSAKTFEDAVLEANNSSYALTGGLFSRNPRNIDFAKNNFNVGNLYINRSCTGAMVERQPFGGFKLSGIGSKAGGPDYLLQFVDPRCTTENTMRRGFAPE